MRLTIIGSRAGVVVNDEASAGYLLTEGDAALLVECGPGVVSRLGKYIALPQLIGVVISHMHWDNYGDLLSLANTRYYLNVPNILTDREAQASGSRAGGPIPVCLPPTGAARVAQIIEVVARGQPHAGTILRTPLAFQDYVPGVPFAVGPFTVSPVGPMVHDAGPSFGFRVACGDAVFAYSGETGMNDALDEAARGADLFLCEATGITAQVRTKQTGRHLSADEAGMIAARARARHLVLTHLMEASPKWYRAMREAASAHFHGPVDVARPTRVFDVPLH